LTKVEVTVHKAVESEDYSAAMACLSTLRSPVDVFFEKVTVNADDPGEREANLSLLARIGATMDQVSDFSKVES
jgi:glycyl-tRNA synthetase beta chain